MPTTRCPCLSGDTYDACCGRLHREAAVAATAEQLMRSRYSAFALSDVAYLLATWHPTRRPAHLDLDRSIRWYRLDVLSTTGGGPFDTTGTVEFRAHYRSPDSNGAQHEASRFVREAGAWRYLDAS